MDVGEIQLEEQPFFDKSVVRDGQRLFTIEAYGEMVEVDAPTVGAQLAFEMTRKFFGCRLDQNRLKHCPLDLQVESFERGRPALFTVAVVEE